MSVFIILFIFICGVIPQNAYAEVETKDFRAVWVSSVFGIDYPKQPTADADSLKKQADEILDGAKEMGMTAVILQVRPAADALYESEIFPWSKYLTGKQGLAPEGDFDPLSYWISGAHERGLALHAWINPYRIANSDAEFEAMTADHPAKQNPSWVVRHTDGKYYWNPGVPEVQEMVIAGAEEIVQGYSVDGLHLDDYFYPGSDFDDAKTFALYGGGFDDIGDWRRENVNRLICGLWEMVNNSGKEVSFGVSPSGIWANRSNHPQGSQTAGKQSYETSYADSRKWVKEGWLDYICPQLYWNIGYSAADYETLAYWWADVVRGTGVELYVGMADYKAGEEDPQSPWNGIGAIRDEIALNRTISEITGEVHFSYQSIADYPELKAYYEAVYHGREPQKEIPRLDKENHHAYLSGDEGYFYPEQSLTRAQAATIFARLMVDEAGEPAFDESARYPTSYQDVSQGKWYAQAIGFVTLSGVMEGYEDGIFLPERPITRAEFAMLVTRFETPSGSVTANFPDVSADHWAAAAISHAKEQGYLSGYEDGTFRPEQNITRAEAVKIINRLLGRQADSQYIQQQLGQAKLFYDVPSSHWAYEEIFEAALGHSYSHEDGQEHWESSDRLPELKPDTIFVSDRIHFVEPELITNGTLVPLDLGKVSAIALHHMAHPTAGFREVEQWHLNRGFDAIGYNFWIGFDGTVSVGRGVHKGAAVANQNSYIISIGFQGDYESVNLDMPREQFEAGVELIRWLSERLPNVDKIGGHGDFSSTLCPGENFPLEEMVQSSGVTWNLQDIIMDMDL